MCLEDYARSAQVQAEGTDIASFVSDEFSALPKPDQKLITSYWGQNVHAVLFIEDTLGYVVASDSISFAEGVYQKMIYDRLAQEASKPRYLDDRY